MMKLRDMHKIEFMCRNKALLAIQAFSNHREARKGQWGIGYVFCY